MSKPLYILEDDICSLIATEAKLGEATSLLSQQEQQVLLLVDGKATASEISTRANGIPHSDVVDILSRLHGLELISVMPREGGVLDFVESFKSKYSGTKPPDRRRLAKRYRAAWRVALMHSKTPDRPICHTLSEDLSMTGIAVQSDIEAAVGMELVFLLAPPKVNGALPKALKIKATVRSCTPCQGRFRLGLDFIPSDEVAGLQKILQNFDLSDDKLPSDQ